VQKSAVLQQEVPTLHWKSHIFSCDSDPSKPIITAYHLYRSVYRDEFPRDPDTRRDYGFDNAHSPKSRTMLLGLYIGLIKYKEVEPIDIHRWRQKGILVQEIKRTFEKECNTTKGEYYPWFLQNQYLLDPLWRPPYNAEERLTLQTWRYIGGNTNDTYQMHRAVYDSWDSEKQHCFHFYHLLHSDSYPTPELDSWVTFGFAASGDETDLAWAYKWLILRECAHSTNLPRRSKQGACLHCFNAMGLRSRFSECLI
jgi:hypothetical protein